MERNVQMRSGHAMASGFIVHWRFCKRIRWLQTILVMHFINWLRVEGENTEILFWLGLQTKEKLSYLTLSAQRFQEHLVALVVPDRCRRCASHFLKRFTLVTSQKRWFIDWDTFLKLVKSGSVQFPTPRNSNSRHAVLTKTFLFQLRVRFWITHTDELLTLQHHQENEKMQSRGKPFCFYHQIRKEKKIARIPKCKTCFCRLVLKLY